MAVVGDEQETKRARTGVVTSTVRQQCWSATFPDDLLAVVYRMITSPRGRMRFAAVCRSWRAAARTVGPLPALPWLLLSPRDGNRKKPMYCPEDGVVVHLQAPGEAVGRWIIGGHDGGWVALPVPGQVRLRIVNLFSGAEVMLPEKKGTMVCPSQHHESGLTVTRSVVFSEPPTSPESILAAITYNCGIALCRLGSPNSGWTVQGCPSKGELINIVFCNGELYGLRCKYGLHYKRTLLKFEIGMNEDGAPIVTAERRLAVERIDRTIHRGDYKCIFDLQGKVAMAWKTQWLPNIMPFFKVFKLVDIPTGEIKTGYKHKWLEVTSLGDHALFLGETLCKAVHIQEDMRSSVERNHIYYSHDYCCLGQNAIVPNDKVFLTISNDSGDHTYYKEDDTKNDAADDNLKMIGSVGYFMKGRFHGGMWILPPDI